MRQTKAGVLALFASILLSGCVNNRYLAPAATFRDSTTKTITTLSAFYSSRNSYEVDLYLSGVAADPAAHLAGKDASGNPTPLTKPAFTSKSIKARLNALALVGVYAARLCELTNSSAPSDFSDASTALGKNLMMLSNDFQSLKNTPSDQTAGAYVQPVATLVTAVGEMYLNRQRNRLVKDAINQGGKPVDIILSQIKDDLNNIFALQTSTGGNEQLDVLIKAYNDDRPRLTTYDQRAARLTQVKAAAESASAATVSAPAQLVAAMQTANDALLAAANPPKGQQQVTFATLNAALSTWSSQINTLASQIQPLVK